MKAVHLQAENISFAYGSRPVIDRLSLNFRRGEAVSLLGPNGCGKTTLLKILLGLLKPKTGGVRFEGVPLEHIPPRQFARRVAYVPQVHRCAFAYTVLEVVMMGRLPHRPFFSRYTPQDREVAMEMLDKMRIAPLWNRSYTEVSGGERQLALIARALAQGADTFIMDEPATALDYGHQVRLLERIMLLAQEGYTFIKSTHFPDHVLWASERVIMLKNGTVVAEGGAEENLNADNFRTLFGVAVRVENAGGRRVCIPVSLAGEKRGPDGCGTGLETGWNRHPRWAAGGLSC